MFLWYIVLIVEKVTFKEFAARMNMSVSQVTKAHQTGKIRIHMDDNGVRYILFEEAKEDWLRNLDHQYSANRKKASKRDDLPSITDSKKKKDFYSAEKTRIELELLQGSVVRSEDVEKEWAHILKSVRTKVLAVPSKMRQRVPDFTSDQHAMLDLIIRETLEDLSNGSDSETQSESFEDLEAAPETDTE